MRYTELKTGDVLTVRHPFVWWKPMRYISAAIRYFTKCKYNHTAITVRCWNEVMVAEAKSKGVSITPYKDWARDLELCVERPIFRTKEADIAKAAMSKQGYVGYDFSGTLFFQLIFQLTGHWLGAKDKERAEKRMYCSEYVAWVFNEVADQFQNFYEIAPDDIYLSDKFRMIVYKTKAKNLL